jgi:hypothetical protein
MRPGWPSIRPLGEIGDSQRPARRHRFVNQREPPPIDPSACHSPLVGETKIYRVALTSKDPPNAVDEFYKHLGEHLPEEGEIINVVRFLRGRVIRARVTRVDSNYNPQIAATEVR